MAAKKKTFKMSGKTANLKGNGFKLAPAPKTPVTKPFTNSQIISSISEQTGLTKKEVKVVFDTLKQNIIKRHLTKNSAGVFVFPGIAKFKVVRKPATKAREGINPFTGQTTTFKAKPARNVVKIRPLSGLKQIVA